MAGVIETYLDDVERQLAADPVLARRLRAELADHLAESMGEARGETAEREALTRLGPARAIVAPLLVDSAGRQAERTWLAMLAAFLAAFVAMRLRTLWLAPAVAEGPVPALAPVVDRWGFVLAMAAGGLGYLLMRRRGMTRAAPAAMGIAAAALAASVGAGLLRIALAGEGGAATLPIALAAAGEAALAATFVLHVRRLRRGIAQARAILSG